MSIDGFPGRTLVLSRLAALAALLLLAACAKGPAATTTSGGGGSAATTSTSPVAGETTSSISSTSPPPRARWSFDSDAQGQAPAGARVFSGTWVVRPEAGSPSPPGALCQDGQAEFPAIDLGGGTFADLAMTARFKPVSGKEDQAAGLIFRIQDSSNYYILRANALEGNVNLYKYVAGRRIGINEGINEGSAKVASRAWQELRVEVKGDHMQGFLNGQAVVEATDAQFRAAGGVGLWTKSDSRTCFDDVTVDPM